MAFRVKIGSREKDVASGKRRDRTVTVAKRNASLTQRTTVAKN